MARAYGSADAAKMTVIIFQQARIFTSPAPVEVDAEGGG
jgi:hypothetical protein